MPHSLHTDTLEQKYGPIRAVVLRHDKEAEKGEKIRETKLVDVKNITRTYALTFIDCKKENKEISEIDSAIREGGLIGQTFRNYGYATKRDTIDVFNVYITPLLQKEFRVTAKKAEARVIEFHTKKDNNIFHYATILEILHPDFKEPAKVNDKKISPVREKVLGCLRENLVIY